MAFRRYAPPAFNVRRFPFRKCALALAIGWLGGCSGIGEVYRAPAVQTHHSQGVPHVADTGQVVQSPIPGGSRVQRVLYHALAGPFHGRDYELESARDAGFTAVHPWEGQDQEAFLNAARKAGLATVPHYPSDAIAARGDEFNVLAWYLDEEPTLRFARDAQPALRRTFRERRSELKALDPLRPVFALLGPPLGRVRPQWDHWAAEGDLTAHDNYAVNEQLAQSTNPARHVARSVSIARDLVPEDRPVWFVIQAFASEDRGWILPSAHEYRAMAMAALIHGASGIVTFAQDSFVTRDDGVLGISPSPIADYGKDLPDYNGDGKAHRIATEDDLRGAVALWQAVADFNHYLTRLDTIPLLPNRTDLIAASAPPTPGLDHPVRVAVKQRDGVIHVLAVNLSDQEVDVDFRGLASLPMVLESDWPYGPYRRERLSDGAWRDTIEPTGVRVYRLTDD